MGLLNKKNIKDIKSDDKKYNITEKDLIGDLRGFPIGVVMRMLEEGEKQGIKPDIKELQKSKSAGFEWDDTEAGFWFWTNIIEHRHFDWFYEKYPEYKKYDE